MSERLPMDACLICGGERGEPFPAAERMFGMGGAFPYAECASCGCLQLCAVPEDLSPYYPADRYYSFSASHRTWPTFQRHPLRSRLLGWFYAPGLFDRRSGGDRAGVRHRTRRSLDWVARLLRHTSAPSFGMAILDVGCGGGDFLRELEAIGFRRLHGADPFLDADRAPSRAVRLHARALEQMPADRLYDLILFNHSLEHIADQHATIGAVRERLAGGGVCRIEVPVAGCEAWEAYGAYWAELDAPRHLVLHTERSMRLLALRHGMELIDVEYVGTPFEFWGSEMYRRGLPLYDEATRATRTPESVFSPEEMDAFRRRSDAANRAGRGGRAVFTLRRAAGTAAAAAAGSPSPAVFATVHAAHAAAARSAEVSPR